jgi:hypothetical protein
MTLRDGGTTCVGLLVDGQDIPTFFTFDFSLPWDGRERRIFVSAKQFGQDEALVRDGIAERDCLTEVAKAVVEELGRTVLDQSLQAERKPTEGKWFYVLNFLRLASKERADTLREVLATL